MITLLPLLLLLPTAQGSDREYWPGPGWETAEPAAVGLDRDGLERARDYALTGNGSGMIVRTGRLVLLWGDPERRYDLKSSTKAIGVTALGLALGDGKMKLDDRARAFHPKIGIPPDSNTDTGWLDEITLRHLATQTAGFEKPGGFGRLLFRPGTAWHYSDAGPNWLAECITLAYRRDVEGLLFERVFTPIGITHADLVWRQNSYRPHEIDGIERREFGSGVSADVDAMARIGLLYLREGRWRDRQLLPRDFVNMVRRPQRDVVGLPEFEPGEQGNASDHYGLLWWNNGDGTLAGVPRDAFWAWGLYDSLIVVIPSLDLVAARAGESWKREPNGGHYDPLRPFLEPIAASVRTAAVVPGAPYPPSQAIVGIDWAPADSVVRAAEDSDNWPMTWGDDDALYTAYGDGYGFEPRAPRKLSLGFAKVVGPPGAFKGINIPSSTGEQIGNGRAGRKASGMLMVDGVLSMWVRNAANAQLAWSRDHGASWTWSTWRFETSFGCPAFVNFGRDGEGARDRFVYVTSPDADGAYEAADRMVLARVPRDRIAEREAYEFFTGLDAQGHPEWAADVRRRGTAFSNPGCCGRQAMSYDAGLRRYLWVQVLPDNDPRGRGGFGVYEAPEPWGPWSTVYLTKDWDIGPGESASFPTKWISADGRTLHLVFSGGDSFAVRQAKLIVPPSNGSVPEH
jgi:CubicO group peptidase (beta-lactamase class C family)